MKIAAHEGGPAIHPIHPTGTAPRSVAIIALGPTSQQWHSACWSYQKQAGEYDEVWTLNKGLRTQRCHVGFVLDDLVTESRKSEEYARDLSALDTHIITTSVDAQVREVFPSASLTEYPINEILWWVGIRHLIARGVRAADLQSLSAEVASVGRQVGYYLHNSIPMILAYAGWLGVRRIGLFGADYTYPGSPAREDDRANAEYWVGMLRAWGVELAVSSDTTLLNQRQQPKIYGYARPPKLIEPTPEQIGQIMEDIADSVRAGKCR